MRLMKVLGVGVGAVLALGIVAIAALYVVSGHRMRRHYELRAEQVVVPTDPEEIKRGGHIAMVRGCTDCHGADLSGKQFIHDAMLGTFYTPNLTAGAGGIGRTFAVTDWEHALRHGTTPDGRGLLIMPSLEFHVLGDEDVGALIAYLQSLPPVDHEWPASRVGPLGRMLLVFNLAPVIPAESIDHAAAHTKAPTPGLTPEYGAYLAVSCKGCHQEDFAGGKIPGMHGLIAANLTMDQTTGLGRWSEGDFSKAMRTGTRPDGSQLNPIMPLLITGNMTDQEVGAIWQFLRSLPVRPARTE